MQVAAVSISLVALAVSVLSVETWAILAPFRLGPKRR